ncbi:MAG: RIO-type serine/threonine-protein kinase Rio2 [Methanoregulaceae archaeon PtaB.Bin108]|jgi:RIO kinase 2|nr:MAG: RIO-type serine/threonine-protein kinase Rio2 [Methanoregulaceae archaeon PtaB.Bin108]OPY39923.1 MAG: RIO-type serine/threonine-protein kinase Rio2 [Methanoregulaceae archaeon PtaU1.Bin222]
MAISAEHIRQLHAYEIRILNTLERLMRTHAWVPLELIRKSTGFSESEALFRLGRLMEWGMVRYDVVPYEGYSLIYSGYDTLALLSLTRKGTISALGPQIGEGKESVVYEALGLGAVALKFHHVGSRSFQSVRLSRDYLPEEGHCPWIFASRFSAEREYSALRILHPAVRVPLPIAWNRGVVAMERIQGVNMHRCSLGDPKKVMDSIISSVESAYNLGVIHADLSEYNVMMDGGKVVLIDWPQWIEPEHPNAPDILRRDIGNILRYFERKYRIRADIDTALAKVTG